jgi:hypothetical protein
MRATDEYRRDVTLAWNISRVFFASKGKKRLITLKDLMPDDVLEERPAPAQGLRTMLHILSEIYQIPIRQVIRGE